MKEGEINKRNGERSFTICGTKGLYIKINKFFHCIPRLCMYINIYNTFENYISYRVRVEPNLLYIGKKK